MPDGDDMSDETTKTVDPKVLADAKLGEKF